ncbi:MULTISPECIES: TetR/AcrR family transcriptional regulator [unclassified Agarivorans]|uniref:TetR/AcrR family transcriptional regulator n=1 Tax=unclassified Agarivorans TaxID=2636026 RepID=UPI0026E41C8E|nr:MULTISPECIES: TetR/AcrR family transcriptional regulator [unclassified Agarivorans]MDO6685604.1 TetR/AcrR family transcriptional regulator [Agarivorans sp. 3_MG-2023]MDO6715990.1 TetR/AcrR family transcriptional regulator [Agarivorans sp. 2_MG-2023]
MTLSQKKRTQIIDAAISEFKAAGYAATSMDRVAQVAQVSKRTVYNHFPSKQALFVGIVSLMLELISAATKMEFASQRSLSEQLRELANKELALFADQEFIALARLVIAEAIHMPEQMVATMQQMSTLENSINNWFESAAKEGLLNTDNSSLACTQFMSLIKGQCFWPQIISRSPMPSPEQTEEIVDSAITMFLSHYQAKAAH